MAQNGVDTYKLKDLVATNNNGVIMLMENSSNAICLGSGKLTNCNRKITINGDNRIHDWGNTPFIKKQINIK
jgi:hypothetical protein